MYEYEGDKDYIFISYSHRDEDKVLHIIERLCNDGYRVWYDAGIEVGSEWPEDIATHLMNCSLFLAFISSDYIDSFNCKREIDYAVSKRKHFIAVWLEQVKMSPGMEMQLSSVQSITWNPNQEEQFFKKLYKSELMSFCRDGAVEVAEETPAKVTIVEEKKEPEIDTVKEKEPEPVPEKINEFIPPHDTEFSNKVFVVDDLGKKAKKTVLTVLATIAAVIILVFIVSKTSKVQIAGEKVSKLEDTVSVKSAELTEADIKNLSKLKKLKYLTFEECSFPENTSEILESATPEVACIYLRNIGNMTDYKWISDLEKLSILEITGSGLTDAGLETIDFSQLSKLKDVDFSCNSELSSIAPLSSCSSIEKLYLKDTAVSDISVLTNKEALKWLNISDTKISDISALAGFTNLLELYADDDNLTEITGMEDKTGLTTLSLNNNDLQTLDGAEALYNLKEIHVSGNKLTSVDGLSSCTKLKNIDLSGNELKDVSAMAKNVGTIENLNLSDNMLTDLSPMAGMNSVKKVILDNNEITDLSFLTSCLDLTSLSANGNKIASLDSIYGLDNLQYLYAANNEIAGSLKLSELPELKEVMVQHNNINEIIFNVEANQYSSLLAAYDNPLYSIKASASGSKKIYTGYISFPEKEKCISAGYEYDPYSFRECFNDIYVSDCPYDERLQFEGNNSYGVEYATIEFMDELLKEQKLK